MEVFSSVHVTTVVEKDEHLNLRTWLDFLFTDKCFLFSVPWQIS